MIRKMMCVLFAAALLLTLGINANAAEDSGSIRISLNVGDLAVTNGAFTIYRIGMKVTDGYRIDENYGGGFVKESDAMSPHLAQWLSEAEGLSGKTILLDADGNAVFSQLGEGLYLIMQTERTDGFYPIQPFLMTIPCENRWNVVINTDPLPMVMESPSTGQDIAPVLGVIGMVMSGIGLYLCTGRGRRRR